MTGLKNEYKEKCEKLQGKLSKLVDSARNFGNAFITRLDKEDLEREKDLDEEMLAYLYNKFN